MWNLENDRLYGYKVSIDDRPHVLLTGSNCLYWFNYYAQWGDPNAA